MSIELWKKDKAAEEEAQFKFYRDMLNQVLDTQVLIEQERWRNRQKIYEELRARTKDCLMSRRKTMTVDTKDLLLLCDMIDALGDEISHLVQEKINAES